MAQIHSAWVERQRRTWLRHDWQKWVRPDWQRWMPPDPGPSMRERLWRPYREEPTPQRSATGLTEADILAFRCNLSALRFKLALLKWRIKAGFNPNQPRVPAGNPDGGQWTSEGGGSSGGGGQQRVRLADAGSAVNPGVTSDALPPGVHDVQNVSPALDSDAGYLGEMPSSIPPRVDIDENIQQAEAHKFDYLWFYNQVHNKGPWDYKQLDKDYADFGNFNYGAAGRAAGFSEDTLLRAAGWAQVQAGNSRPEWGTSVSLLEALLGIGGKPPFGDDPKDQFWISQGFKYYDARRRGR